MRPTLSYDETNFLSSSLDPIKNISKGSGDSEFLPLWKILNNGNLSCDVDLNVYVYVCVSL